jgi:hypothetical protein
MRRLAIVARLKEGAHDRAEALLSGGPPFDPQATGIDRHTVYLTSTEVVFVFEGRDVEWEVDDLLSAYTGMGMAIEAWRPLLDGEPKLGREAYSWERPSAAEPGPSRSA